MLRTIISLAGIGCTLISGAYTAPVVKGAAMAQTLTESSPGSYLVNVTESNYNGTERRVRVTGTEIIVDCRGLPSDKVLIKYDGFKASCRFRHSS